MAKHRGLLCDNENMILDLYTESISINITHEIFDSNMQEQTR
jgi:hypothetical protein